MKKISGQAGAMTIASNEAKRLFLRSMIGKDRLTCQHSPDVEVCEFCFSMNVIKAYTPSGRKNLKSMQLACERAIQVTWETLFRDREVWLMRHGHMDAVDKGTAFINKSFKRGGR